MTRVWQKFLESINLRHLALAYSIDDQWLPKLIMWLLPSPGPYWAGLRYILLSPGSLFSMDQHFWHGFPVCVQEWIISWAPKKWLLSRHGPGSQTQSSPWLLVGRSVSLFSIATLHKELALVSSGLSCDAIGQSCLHDIDGQAILDELPILPAQLGWPWLIVQPWLWQNTDSSWPIGLRLPCALDSSSVSPSLFTF